MTPANRAAEFSNPYPPTAGRDVLTIGIIGTAAPYAIGLGTKQAPPLADRSRRGARPCGPGSATPAGAGA